jgi:putative MFS transporter
MFAFTAVGKLIDQASGLYGLESKQDGLYSTVLYTGMFFGAEFWARVCDRHGRKVAFIGTLVFGTSFYFLTPLFSHYYLIMLCMFGIGIGSGGGLVTRGTLLVEWLPADKRGALVGALGVFWPIGGSLASAISWVVIGKVNEPFCGGIECGWRAFFIVLGALQLLFIITTCAVIPESPRWLSLQGKNEELENLLAKCFGSAATAQLAELSPSEKEQDSEVQPQPPISALFHPKLRRTTTMLWIIWFWFSFGAASFYVLLPTLLKEGGFSDQVHRVLRVPRVPEPICA